MPSSVMWPNRLRCCKHEINIQGTNWQLTNCNLKVNLQKLQVVPSENFKNCMWEKYF